MNRSLRLVALSSFIALTGTACGSKPAPIAKTPSTTTAAPAHSNDSIAVSSEVGALDEDAVNGVFEKCQNSLMNCIRKGASRVELLGGDAAFFLAVNLSGHAEDARLEHSTIGDRDTEACMLQVLRSRTWPKPVGGRKGQVRKSFSFDMPNEARPPVEWSADDIVETLKKLQKHADKCTGGGSNAYQITAYIDTRGSAISVGVASADTDGDSKIDCIVELVKNAKFKSPGSYPAKVSFEL